MKFPNPIPSTCANCLWVIRQRKSRHRIIYNNYQCNLNNLGMLNVAENYKCDQHTRLNIPSRRNAIAAMERYAWYVSGVGRI